MFQHNSHIMCGEERSHETRWRWMKKKYEKCFFNQFSLWLDVLAVAWRKKRRPRITTRPGLINLETRRAKTSSIHHFEEIKLTLTWPDVKYLFNHSKPFSRCQSIVSGWADSDVDKCQKQTLQTFEMSHGEKFIKQSKDGTGNRDSRLSPGTQNFAIPETGLQTSCPANRKSHKRILHNSQTATEKHFQLQITHNHDFRSQHDEQSQLRKINKCRTWSLDGTHLCQWNLWNDCWVQSDCGFSSNWFSENVESNDFFKKY